MERTWRKIRLSLDLEREIEKPPIPPIPTNIKNGTIEDIVRSLICAQGLEFPINSYHKDPDSTNHFLAVYKKYCTTEDLLGTLTNLQQKGER
jgi:hypothetical protein